MHDFHVQFQTIFLGAECLSLFSSVQFWLVSAFVKSGIIKDSVSVVRLWPRLTKLTSILIILPKKKTHPIIVDYAQLKWKFWSSSLTMDQTSSCASKPETENKWTFSFDDYPSIRSGEGVALDASRLKSLWRWSVHLTVDLRGSRFRRSSSSWKGN